MRALTATALGVFLLDQASKVFVLYGLGLAHRLAIDVVPPFLNLRMAWNRGLNFGLFSNETDVMRWVFVGVALAVSVWVVLWARSQPGQVAVQLAAGALVGGALGNALDRVVYGAVADFLNMSCCGINNPFAFNIADVGVFAGAIGLVLFAGRHKTP
ncbi:signal peptidase II [Rhodovulum iodosum]|uniref:Lipoprotein signal peptidase n=1 Tax=Rhodovulum iodosum TaxID=68291 RepID=A0ABV3XQT9_9RHOB|nr:signal peptidase II [Rhodovulum robiginosum]RSK32884.1 signal peptidase II [Rhodovulum robiginosum]